MLNFEKIKVGDKLKAKDRIALVRKIKPVVFNKGEIVEVVKIDTQTTYNDKKAVFTVENNSGSIIFKDWDIHVYFELVEVL